MAFVSSAEAAVPLLISDHQSVLRAAMNYTDKPCIKSAL